MKKVLLFILILLLNLSAYSQDISPGGITSTLLTNTSLDNILYEKFYTNYGKPDKVSKDEKEGYTAEYNFVNKAKGMRQEIHFIHNEYGKITSILYYFPSSFKVNVENSLNSVMPLIQKDVWYNAKFNLTYTFVDLAKIDVASDKKDVVILMIFTSK
jgi:hypothetical protein